LARAVVHHPLIIARYNSVILP